MKIHLPDKGLTLNFPDGMTEDQMRDAINRNFYPEKLSAQPPAPAAPQPARAMPELSPQPAAPEDYYPPEFAGFADPNLAANVEREIREYGSTDRNAPNYWDLGTIGKGFLKGIAGLGTRKAERADIETARAFRQSNAPTHRPNLLELGMAAMSDPSVLDVQDGEKQARAAAEIEAYNSATRAQALRENAEWWDPGEYHVPTEGMGKVLHDLAVNAPYTLKNMPLAAAATLVAGPYGAVAGSIPGALGEGLDEGADVYRRLIEKGVDPNDAYKQYLSHADKVGLGLMISDPLQNMATFGLGKLFPNAGTVARTLGGLLFDMGAEGAEEVLEGVAANRAVGDPNDWNELGYEGLLGALSGGLFGGGGMAVNAIANAMAKENTSAATETGAATEPHAPVAEVLEELRKEDDARQALPRGERAELMRWARSETGRMAEEAQFSEDGTPENPLSEADLIRYQEIQDAMKRRDYAALSAMRGEAEAQPNLSQSVPSEAGAEHGDTTPAMVDAPVNAEVNTTSNSEGYEQQGVGPAGTAPDQAESAKAKGAKRPRTPAEIRRLAKDVEARMIAAGRDVEEAKAMGLLASEFAGRFAKRTGIQPAEALNFEMRQGKAQGARGGGYDQSSVRQSEDYDPGDPKTWPEGPGRDEALALEAWQNLENDDEIETWPESPEKARALELQNESRQIDAWIENLSREEFDRRLRDDDPEFVWKNERGVELEKELRSLRRDLRKKKPKGAERRLLQLIEAEEEAAAREAEDAQEYYQDRPETTENIRRGQAAMEKVIAERTDVMDAMHRDDLGSISFLWGEPGRGPKFKGGSGVSHIIAHRNAQGYDGEAVARKMVEVIAKGKVDRRYGAEVPGGERANIVYDGHTAALSLYKDGDRKTWLLTGWKDYEEKAPGEVGPVYDGLNPTLSKATRFHPEEGAGAFNEKSPGASSKGDGSTGATLSGPMRTRPEEGAGASDNSKPPVAQKDKGESTAPNGRTYFLPDGTSVIEFFETANKSTSFHEFGHHILNKMVEFSSMEGVDPQLAEDVKTILEEAGVTREAFDADTDGARTRAHEFFARGFETYLSEGKAPTVRLRDAFRRIRNWMIEVYNDTAKALGIKLSDEMRGVYDRLFASDGAFGDIYGAEDVKAGTNDPAKTQGDAQPRPKTVTTKTRGGVEVERKVRDTSNDTRMMDLFNSPSVVAKRHGKFRPFFGMAKEAVEKQERMRSNWNKAVDAIYGRKGRGGLLKKDQVSLFNETLLEGDALSRVFTSEELQERGFDTNMARAYRLVRGLYDNAHRMLSAQRNKYGKEDMEYRKGYVPHFFHAWRVLDDKGIVTSFRSMNEAIKAAKKMKKEGENRNIRVAPALDDFGGRGKLDAVTLGDTQYSKLMENVEKAFELSAKEARTLLEGAARTKNRSRVFKNAWERKGVAGFDANMEYALRHYLNLSARYIAMDTLKHDGIHLFERAFGRFDNDHKGLARYTKDYINDVLGVPSDVEQTLNNWVRNSWLGKFLPNIIGDRPATVAANSIASLVAHCKLGFLNIASAAMNLSQLNGTQAIIGPIWTARALKEYLHPNQMTLRLYADAGVEENITAENPSGYSKVHQARGLLADTSMMAFRLVDGMARKVTLIGAYRKVLSQGMNRSAAIEYAKQVNDDVNFDYSVADAPNFIRRTGPIGTLLFQFKKFPVKMLELALPGVGKLKGWEQVRFWAPLVALTGVFGLPGFDWLKDWLKSIFGKDLELETKKLIAESSLPEPVKRTILYGALSNLGIDVGRRAGMGDFFPSELKDLTGPAAATVARVAESLPKIFDDGNFMDTIEALSPGLANPIKAVMGEARDRRRGRVAFRYETPGERIARATGARPIREAIENDAVRIVRYEQQKRSTAEADAIDDFIRAREDSDVRALDRARDRLRKLRITPDRIRAEMIRRRSPDGGESTAYERAMRGARMPRRIQDYRAMENYAAMWE